MESFQGGNSPIPESLRSWFLIHFIVDYIVATPLFLWPVQTLAILGLEGADPFMPRLVAAALFAIGGISFLVRNASRDVYRHLLTLKIIWSVTAIIGILFSYIQTGNFTLLIVAFVFGMFSIVWMYYLFAIIRGEFL